MRKLQKIRCKIAEFAGKLAKYLVKMGRGMGKSFPGYLYLKIGAYDCLRELAKRPKIGTILITGTNGKTTSTKITCLLLEKDTKISCNFDSNTLNAIATGFLSDRSELGVFEYGIRDIKNSVPDLVCELVDPVGVVYTNISREHPVVGGRKNPFEKYLKAKELLSAPMKRGIVICNADDPRTASIGMKKEVDTLVTYYGFEVDLRDRTPITADVFCPLCKNNLNYHKRYLNHRGLYKCKCGFSRPEPHIKLTNLSKKHKKWEVEIKGKAYNYTKQKNVSLNFMVEIPIFGVHNLYNLLCGIASYVSFTPYPEKIEETVRKTCENMDSFVLPPGRFEIFKTNSKVIGMGQGDNGDALKANLQLLSCKDMIFVYTTPDEDEDEIFEDHLNALISSNPKKIYVFPGRESVPAAAKYYKIIKESFDSEFYPISNKEMNKKIDEILGIIEGSKSRCVVVSGCGPEHLMWDKLKSRFKFMQKISSLE